MEIVLGLLATLVAIVILIAVTAPLSRQLEKGTVLTWTGAGLMCLFWLMNYGYVAFQIGSGVFSDPTAVTVRWLGFACTLLGSLAFVLAIAQIAGVSLRFWGKKTPPDTGDVPPVS